ncbi:hypothetical protein [Ornithinimicrobium cerasi]|uniref:Anti-sigma-D factor RsdA to sigma factor binding region n=1 Tax=Ornithinimicrobium cerasi TaxID=2248773 RepID=A0A285VNN4_9MICO|nr:hypothetical protein [Ornithinimicrobium cerasi]SOC55573.1 hypothetical protein SAMN05421879_105151 [Ornithinimicrobium cerasi]
MSDIARLDHHDLDRAELLLDDLGARRVDAGRTEDPVVAALAAWVESIDAPGGGAQVAPTRPPATVTTLPVRRRRPRRTARRVVAGSVLTAVVLAGSSVAAALTGSQVPLLTAVGTVLVDVVPLPEEMWGRSAEVGATAPPTQPAAEAWWTPTGTPAGSAVQQVAKDFPPGPRTAVTGTADGASPGDPARPGDLVDTPRPSPGGAGPAEVPPRTSPSAPAASDPGPDAQPASSRSQGQSLLLPREAVPAAQGRPPAVSLPPAATPPGRGTDHVVVRATGPEDAPGPARVEGGGTQGRAKVPQPPSGVDVLEVRERSAEPDRSEKPVPPPHAGPTAPDPGKELPPRSGASAGPDGRGPVDPVLPPAAGGPEERPDQPAGATPPAQGVGTLPVDAAPVDAGAPPVDAGTPPVEAGAPPPDAGTPPVEAGAPPVDAGTPPEDADDPAPGPDGIPGPPELPGQAAAPAAPTTPVPPPPPTPTLPVPPVP